MKIQPVNVLTKIGLLSAMVLATAVTSAQGQSLANRIRANIPFDFSVADKRFPSGKYSVGRARQDSDDTVLSIADVNGRPKAVRSSIPVQMWEVADKAMLVFHRYGDQYFLFQVWPAGESTGRQFYRSRAEREIQRNLAANSSSGNVVMNQVETVTIVGVLQ